MPYLDLPGVKLWYIEAGRGDVPVVFMHAASGTSDSWLFYQFPAFVSAGCRCLAYDRRGWGQSQADPASGEQPGCASDDLLAFVDRLGLDRFHLVGTAAGAAPSVDFALSHPERLRSLVLSTCTGGVQEPEYLAWHERARPPEFQALPTYLRETSAGYRGSNPEGLRRWIQIERASRGDTAARQRPRNHITYAALEALAVPVLAITGGADATTPPALMRLFIPHLPNCAVVDIPEAGHAAFWEQPDVWNRHVLEFIRAR